MSGVICDGRHAGGRAYGYRPVPGKPGQLQIDEDEAAVVREIFESYVGGKTPREIAMRLNARKVPQPRGRYWTASTLNGSLKRHNGVIQNDIYAGRIVERYLCGPHSRTIFMRAA
jgi:site-specific DNA recombinase